MQERSTGAAIWHCNRLVLRLTVDAGVDAATRDARAPWSLPQTWRPTTQLPTHAAPAWTTWASHKPTTITAAASTWYGCLPSQNPCTDPSTVTVNMHHIASTCINASGSAYGLSGLGVHATDHQCSGPRVAWASDEPAATTVTDTAATWDHFLCTSDDLQLGLHGLRLRAEQT